MDAFQLFILGLLLIVGWLAHGMGRFVHVPRVTILLVLGVIAGPSVFDLIPPSVAGWFPQVTHMALAMVGFLLGERFIEKEFRRSGQSVIWISIGETLGAALVVFAAVYLLTDNLLIAMLLAGIAPASAPAATLDIVHEYHARGPLTRTVLGVVAIDDAWGIMLFSLLLVAAEAVSGSMSMAMELLWGLWDVAGAILLGIVVGVPMAWCTGRLKKGEPSLLEAAGFVFVCGGLALLLEVSYLLACMVLGATVANRATHHTRPFREIEGIADPFLVVFFLLAGYECDLQVLMTLGVVGLVYIIARSAGLILGGNLTARFSGADPVVQRHVGWCLLPQAGVALGMALMIGERLGNGSEAVLPLVIATTIVFEIGGPLITRWHLQRAGELHD